MEMVKEECSKQANAGLGNHSGANILESCNSDDDTGDNNKSVVVDSVYGDNSVLGGTVHAVGPDTDRLSAWAESYSEENT